jgi:hypothetical protein
MECSGITSSKLIMTLYRGGEYRQRSLGRTAPLRDRQEQSPNGGPMSELRFMVRHPPPCFYDVNLGRL